MCCLYTPFSSQLGPILLQVKGQLHILTQCQRSSHAILMDKAEEQQKWKKPGVVLEVPSWKSSMVPLAHTLLNRENGMPPCGIDDNIMPPQSTIQIP